MVHRADLSRDESNRVYSQGLPDELTSEHLFYIIAVPMPIKGVTGLAILPVWEIIVRFRRRPSTDEPRSDRDMHQVHPAPYEAYRFGAPKVAPQTHGIAARLRRHISRQQRGSDTRLTLEIDSQTSAHLQRSARDKALSPELLASDLLTRALGQEKQRRRAEAALETLTPREQEITQLAARGLTNLQIADALVISPETVKSHIRHALAKLGLRSKMDLRLLFLDLGIRWWQDSAK